MENEAKEILQKEADKIGDILEKMSLSDKEIQYFKNLKKFMLDKKRGFRKPLKDAKEEARFQYVCEQILNKKIDVNDLLVTGRKIHTTPKSEDIDRRNVLRHNRTTKQKSKLFSIPENEVVLKGGRKSRKSRKTKKSKKVSWK